MRRAKLKKNLSTATILLEVSDYVLNSVLWFTQNRYRNPGIDRFFIEHDEESTWWS